MTLRPARACAPLLLALTPLALLTACGGSGDDGNPWRARPTFLAGEPTRTDYDGTNEGLLTGRAASLSALVTFKPSAAPTPSELRTLAIQSSYTGLLDVTPAGGFGTYFGRITAAGNRGSEYVAVTDDGSGTRNVTTVVGIPSNFDPQRPCIVAIPSSGSRPVYGEVGTIGEWAYNKGCATALTDKGTGFGAHDLDRDLAYQVDGTMVTAGTRRDLTFNANLLGDDLASYRAANPNRVALKHAHGKQNPEKDWGRYTLQAVQVALYVLNRHFPTQEFMPSNTLVIAASISNGGAAVLRAAEQDDQGLIDAVVAAEPQVNLPANAALQVRRGGAAVPLAARPLVDYTTYAGLFQACASQAPALRATAAFTIAPIAAGRCTSLAAMGLVTGSTLDQQSADALAKLRAYGWEAESDILHDSHYGFEFTDLVATTYVNAYARASVTERPCGYSFAGTDAATFALPVPPAAAAMRTGWATGGGLGFLAGAFNISYDRAAGGPALYLTSVSPSTGRADFALEGAACLRRLATGGAVGNTQPDAGEQAFSTRLRSGVDEVRVGGHLRGKPAIVLHGRSDALIPVNHTSRPYVALNGSVETGSRLRYLEVTDANHFDALVGLYPRTLVPLHVYTGRALDLMFAHLTAGTDLPASQVIRAVARNSPTATLTDANVPPIPATPAAASQIAVGSGTIDVPN